MPEKICKRCSVVFQREYPNQRYCGLLCFQDARALTRLGEAQAHYRKYAEKIKSSARNYYAANKEKVSKTAKLYRQKNRHRIRDRRLREKYGIGLAEYGALLDKQQNVCAICSQKPRRRPLDVDHCHETSKVRGLLCESCNKAIGLLRDNTVLLKKAIDYLEPKFENVVH